MFPMSNEYVQTWQTAGRVITTGTIQRSGVPIVDNVLVSSGTVTIDRIAAQRSRVTLTVPTMSPFDPIIPTSDTSALTPFGNELVLQGGYYIGDTPVMFPMGTYTIVDVDVEDTMQDITLTVDVYDRAWGVSARKFRYPYWLNSGANAGSELERLINTVYPGLTYLITPTSYTAGFGTFTAGSDPWQAATQLAESIGYELYFDVYGRVIARPTPNPANTAPCWWFVEGVGPNNTDWSAPFSASNPPPNCASALGRKWSRQNLPNDITITNSTSATGISPFQGSAVDVNPQSPTYVGGPFGDVPQVTVSRLATTAPAATALAENVLIQTLGSGEMLTITMKPNPVFEVDDVVYVQRKRLGLAGNYVIDAITHSFKATDKTVLTCRNVAAGQQGQL